MTLEKTNVPGYMKDPKNGMVINTNEGEYEQILAAREKRAKEKALEESVHKLKSDMDVIKSMLSQLLNRT